MAKGNDEWTKGRRLTKWWMTKWDKKINEWVNGWRTDWLNE